MRELIRIIGLLSIRQVGNVIFSLVRAKVLAVLLGPSGFGIVSQATNLLNLLWSTASGGISPGATVLIAQNVSSNDFARVNKIITTAWISLTLLGSIVFVGSVAFADQIALAFLGAEKYAGFVRILATAVWFAVQTSAIDTLFRGLLKIRAYTAYHVVGNGIAIACILILVYFFGLDGAIFSILVGQVLNAVIGLVILKGYVLSEFKTIGFVREKPDWDTLRQILNLAGPLAFVQIVAGASQLILRGEVLRRLGEDANGFYQVVWGISLAYMMLVNDANRSYVLPEISSHLDQSDKILLIQNNMIRICLLLFPPFLLVLLAFRGIWIPILYSREFLFAESLLLWQFAGDFLVSIRININSALVPRRRFTYLILEAIVSNGGWLALSLWLMPIYGLAGVPMGYFIANTVLLLSSLTYHYHAMGFRVLPENIRVAAVILPLFVGGLGAAQFISGFWIPMAVVFLTIGLMVVWIALFRIRPGG